MSFDAERMPKAAELPDPNLFQCEVLLVDDDIACVEEYGELLSSLGYESHHATDAPQALRLLAGNRNIGIIITDIGMPSMNGIAFLNEISARFDSTRPIVSIVVTGFSSLDYAVQAMRYNAVDFLTKPVSFEDFGGALRRASMRWTQLLSRFRLAYLQASVAKGQPSRPAVDVEKGASFNFPTQDQLLKVARSIIRRRKSRTDFLSGDLFSDPSWDILLDLTTAKFEQKLVPVSAACAAADVPFTTAFRYLNNLVDLGLVRRCKDPNDGRRIFVELEEKAVDAMEQYLCYAMRSDFRDPS